MVRDMLLGAGLVSAASTFMVVYLQKRERQQKKLLKAAVEEMNHTITKEKNEWEENKDKLSERLLSQEEKIKDMEEERKTGEIKILKMEKRLEDVEAEEKRKCQLIAALNDERGEERKKWQEERLQLIRDKQTLLQKCLAAEQQLEDMTDKMKSTENKLLAAEQKTEDMQNRLKMAENKVLSAEQQIKDLQTEMESKENQLLSAEQRVEDMQNGMKMADHKALSAEQQIKDLQTEMESKENQLLSADQRVEDMQNRMKMAEHKALSAEQQIKDLQTEMESKENQLLSAEQRVEDMQNRMKMAEHKALAAEQQIKDMQTEMESKENKLLSAEQRVEKMQNWVKTAENKVLQMEETINTMEEEQREERKKWEAKERLPLISAKQDNQDMNKMFTTDNKVLKMEKMQNVQPVNKWTTHFCELTLDPNTANGKLSLSKNNKEVAQVSKDQSYAPHPDRFVVRKQVLCKEGLTGSCFYYEVEWRGGVSVAVTYAGINRKGKDCDSLFGSDDKSWRLLCEDDRHGNKYTFRHNGENTVLSVIAPDSNRVGVYLDWPAGTLSFYIVSSDTRAHLHTWKASRFTEPLYAGFGFRSSSSLSLCPREEVQ